MCLVMPLASQMVIYCHMSICGKQSLFYLLRGGGGKSPHSLTLRGAVMAQLASARLSEQEVPSSILGDLNICFDFPLIRVAIALNTLKTEH